MYAIKFLPRILLFIPVGSLLISGCLPDESLSELDTVMPSPQLSFPLMKTDVNLTKIIDVQENGLLSENEDNSYSVYYSTEFSSPELGTFFESIPDQYFSKDFSAGISAPFYSITPPAILQSGEIELDFAGQQFDEIGCKGGTLSVSMSSEYEHEIEVKLTFPEVIDQAGQSVVMNFLLNSSGFASEEKSFDLNGYTISPDQNKLQYELEFSIHGSGNPIDAAEMLHLDLFLTSIDFTYLEGKFKEFQIPVDPGLIEIPFLNNTVGGSISLNPKIKLKFTNSFGIPSLADFSNIYIEGKSGSITLEDRGNGDFFHANNLISYPATKNDLAATFEYTIENGNSNIEDAFANIPQKMNYLIAFKAGTQSDETNFITDESRIVVETEAEIPLAGIFDVVMQDTISIDLSELDNVENLKIVIQSENDFPLDADLQVFFMDDFGNLLTDQQGQVLRLFDEEEKFLNAATIINEATGETSPVNTSPISATIDGEKFDYIRDASNFLIVTKLKSKSSEDDNVKLYSFYNIKLALAMQVKATLDN